MKRPSSGGFARLLIAAALTAYVLWRSDPPAVLRAASHAHVVPILGALLLVLVDRTLMAYRWVVLLCTVDPADRPSLGLIMRIFFVSTFVGTFLPASIGGDAVRAYSLARHHVNGADAVASVFMDRMLGVLSLIVMSAIGLLLARELATNRIVLTALLVVATLCTLIALVIFNAQAAEASAALIVRFPLRRIQRFGAGVISSIQKYARHHVSLLNVLACSMAVQAIRILQAYLLGRALGIDAALVAYFAFVPLILLVMLLPVTLNGLGTSQAAFVWFFARVQVPHPEAFALSVLFVALGVVGNLPGGVLYATGGMRAQPSRQSG